jgi:hypothetical protein
MTTGDAVFWRLEVIGDASRKIGSEFRQQHPDIPWREMGDLRIVLIHDYEWTDPEVACGIVENHIPGLFAAAVNLLATKERWPSGAVQRKPEIGFGCVVVVHREAPPFFPVSAPPQRGDQLCRWFRHRHELAVFGFDESPANESAHLAFFFAGFLALFLAVLLADSPGGLPTPIERVSQFGCLHFGQRTGLPGTRLTQA